MFFILLSIVSFVLRTLPIFEIVGYEFLTIYNDKNLIEQTPVHIRQHREIFSIFDIIEWICMKKILFEISFEILILFFV